MAGSYRFDVAPEAAEAAAGGLADGGLGTVELLGDLAGGELGAVAEGDDRAGVLGQAGEEAAGILAAVDEVLGDVAGGEGLAAGDLGEGVALGALALAVGLDAVPDGAEEERQRGLDGRPELDDDGQGSLDDVLALVGTDAMSVEEGDEGGAAAFQEGLHLELDRAGGAGQAGGDAGGGAGERVGGVAVVVHARARAGAGADEAPGGLLGPGARNDRCRSPVQVGTSKGSLGHRGGRGKGGSGFAGSAGGGPRGAVRGEAGRAGRRRAARSMSQNPSPV